MMELSPTLIISSSSTTNTLYIGCPPFRKGNGNGCSFLQLTGDVDSVFFAVNKLEPFVNVFQADSQSLRFDGPGFNLVQQCGRDSRPVVLNGYTQATLGVWIRFYRYFAGFQHFFQTVIDGIFHNGLEGKLGKQIFPPFFLNLQVKNQPVTESYFLNDNIILEQLNFFA